MNFLSYHTLALYNTATIFFLANPEYLVLCIFCRFCPYYFGSTFRNSSFKPFQLFIQGFNRFPLYVFRFFPYLAQILELLFSAWHYSIIAANIKIDLLTVIPVCTFLSTFFDKIRRCFFHKLVLAVIIFFLTFLSQLRQVLCKTLRHIFLSQPPSGIDTSALVIFFQEHKQRHKAFALVHNSSYRGYHFSLSLQQWEINDN